MVEKGIVEDPNFLAKEKALMDLYDKGQMEVRDYIEFSMKPLLRFTKDEVKNFVSSYVKRDLVTKFYPEALSLIQEYKQRGVEMIIISATASFIVKEVAKYLGIDTVLAIDIKSNGDFYSTKIASTPSFKEGKVIRLEQYLRDQDKKFNNIIFYSDSINDMPLFLRADEKYVVNPSQFFEKIAKEHNFSILK